MNPNNPNNPNTTAVDSVQNKGLLWTTLQESGAFAGLSRDQFQPVQSAFDRAVQQAAAASGNASLSDVNKGIIREFMQVLRLFQMSQNNANNANNANNPNNPQKKKKIELVYRAEDLQNERASEFDRNLREKQAEMDSFLTLKKPNDVNFTDKEPDDKPIGDEMARLIAQELAARERELVQLKPEDIKKAQQWIGTSANKVAAPLNNTSTLNPSAAKKVSFVEEEHEIEQFEPEYNKPNPNEFIHGENFEEMDIFSKFKKINESLSEPNAPITLQQLYNKLIELEQNMNAKHEEIMARLNNGMLKQ